MKPILTGLAGLGLLTACAIPPQGIDPQRLAVFDTAVASIGCDLVSEADYIPVELQTGLTRDQVQEVAAYKLQLEEGVSLSNGGFRSKVGTCADSGQA